MRDFVLQKQASQQSQPEAPPAAPPGHNAEFDSAVSHVVSDADIADNKSSVMETSASPADVAADEVADGVVTVSTWQLPLRLPPS